MYNEKTDTNELMPLVEAGMILIPLHKRSKVPCDRNWPKRPYKNENQIGHMKSGGNVGVRLRASELVVDVDPRNFTKGDDPLVRFCKDHAIDLTEYPKVKTGAGGLHIYMTKPKDEPVRDSLPEYKGVEFKTIGRQVVAPGSVHPDTGHVYRWISNEDDLWCMPSAPRSLIDAICRRAPTSSQGETRSCSPPEIAKMLKGLDPLDFRDHEHWLELMMACHYTSGGSARQEFIAWSMADPNYANHGERIMRRWDSLSSSRDGALITNRTLFRLLQDAGVSDLIPLPSAAEDFDVVTSEDIPEAALQEKPTEMDRLLDSDAPMVIASEMLRGKPLLRSNGEWFRYDKELNHYVAVADERFTSWCWKWTHDRSYLGESRGKAQVKSLAASRSRIANIEEAARSQRQGPDKAPCWIKPEPADPPVEEVLICANGLLHLPTRTLLPPDRRLFSVNGSPVSYDPAAPLPERWLRFMEELFPDERDCIETLQEATGYFLTQDTSLQKIVQLVGPPRAGKGVYTRVLQCLIGQGNYTSPAPKRLAGEFGLQPLIGKQLAVISDMRLGRGVNMAALTETLLTISGEDSVSISRKYNNNWEGTLSTRFFIVSNEVLQLRDTSDALGARMIVIKTRQSFLGNEDEGLSHKLTRELSGILNWALDGLDRLRKRGRFVQPKSCMADVMQMHKLTSPVKWFLDYEIVTAPEHRVRKDRLWEVFCKWTYEEGLSYSGGKEHFFKDLNSAGGRYVQSRPSENGQRVAYLNGLDLRTDLLESIYGEARRDFSNIED